MQNDNKKSAIIPVPSPLLDRPPKTPLLPLKLPKRSKKTMWWVLGIVTFLLVAAAAAATGGYVWYKSALEPVSNQHEPIKVTIAPGASNEQVTSDLEQKGLIKSALAAMIYIRLEGKGDIKAGSYMFEPRQSTPEIIQWLNDGRVDTFKLTILPGKTLAELKEDFVQDYGFSAREVDQAFSQTYKSDLFKGKPAKASLEGYIYPETYFVPFDIAVEQLLQITFDEFDKQIKQHKLVAALDKRGFTLWQGVILASIIEKEVPTYKEERQVAQVFEKRLREDMPLGSDPTYKYAAKILGVEPSTTLESPYNTRLHKGLPPGPIGNFNLQALQAVADPVPGDYLYFVSGDDGITRFSRTLQEHEENIQKYCIELCAQP